MSAVLAAVVGGLVLAAGRAKDLPARGFGRPDFHPTLASGNPVMRAFWEGWLAWAADQGIDYFVGRRIAPWLARLGFDEIEAHGETILYNGGALPAQYLKLTMQELEAPLRGSGLIAPSVWAEAMALFDAPQAWSWQNCYVTTVARRPAA